MLDQVRKLTAAAVLSALAVATPVQADGIMEEPLPRFEDRICPGVLGMEREYAELMVAHLRDNVEMFGLRLAGSEEEGCEPNLVIAFVDDGRGYLQELMQRRSYLFADMDRPDREELVAGDAPYRVWHQVAARTRDGIRVGSRENLTQPPEAGMWQAHSRIYRPVRHDITYALVLIDSAAVEGLTLRQLADFATLQALATEFPDGAEDNPGSMLRLFEGDDTAPESLGPVDAEWLAQLYNGIPNLPASMRLRSVEVATAD
ncbi:hypothetical protein [Aurantiacibacter gilvus]|uniref:Uncharacterized protein n=1 Tax=Aurantiacibacter gilvus TaxID=3139141 RepID=A0ABU9I9H2_9SPHN